MKRIREKAPEPFEEEQEKAMQGEKLNASLTQGTLMVAVLAFDQLKKDAEARVVLAANSGSSAGLMRAERHRSAVQAARHEFLKEVERLIPSDY
jgi:hypothetical protein